MRNSLIIGMLATATMLAQYGTAQACPIGYKRVTIQGNSVCQLDVSASNSLKAPTKGGTIDPLKAVPRRVAR